MMLPWDLRLRIICEIIPWYPLCKAFKPNESILKEPRVVTIAG